MKVFVSRLVPQKALQPLLDAGCAVDMYERDAQCPHEELLRRCREADALIVQGLDRIDQEVLDSASNVKVITCCSIGYDNVDLAAARSRGVVVCNAPAAELVATTAEAAVALLLSVAKRITRLHVAQHAKRLPRYSFIEPSGLPVRKRVSGIIGAGRIGVAIARIMRRGFDNSIVYFGRSAKPDFEQEPGARRLELDELLSESDFVFVVVPLTDGTRNLLHGGNLKRLRRHAIIVNIARAGVVNDAALVQLLSEERIFGAGLDVYTADAAKCDHPNLVLTGHLANGEHQAMQSILELAVSNVVAILNNEPPISPVRD